MTDCILISADQDLCSFWPTWSPGAVVVAAPEAALDLIEPGSIVWLHVARNMPDPVAAVAMAARALAPGRIVALSDRPNDEEALQLLDAGAVGYCHARAAAPTLQQVGTVVANGGLWVGQSLLTRLIGALQNALPQPAAPDQRLDRLSPREREAAIMAGSGASNREIAARLCITERTVKAHLSAVFAKLGVRDRLQLALLLRGSQPHN
jgi:DNA-binding NarL/FixJ family response regulator